MAKRLFHRRTSSTPVARIGTSNDDVNSSSGGSGGGGGDKKQEPYASPLRRQRSAANKTSRLSEGSEKHNTSGAKYNGSDDDENDYRTKGRDTRKDKDDYDDEDDDDDDDNNSEDNYDDNDDDDDDDDEYDDEDNGDNDDDDDDDDDYDYDVEEYSDEEDDYKDDEEEEAESEKSNTLKSKDTGSSLAGQKEGGLTAEASNSSIGGGGSLVNFDIFSDQNFRVQDFVDTVAARSKQCLSSNMYSGAKSVVPPLADFDPEPLSAAFSRTMDDLANHRSLVLSRLEAAEAACEDACNEHALALSEQFSTTTQISQSYDQLDFHLAEAVNTAVRIGDQLETIERQRANAVDARELLKYFMDFTMGVTERLDSLHDEALAASFATPEMTQPQQQTAKSESNAISRNLARLNSTNSLAKFNNNPTETGTPEQNNNADPSSRATKEHHHQQQLTKVAVIARRLLHIARHVDAPGTEQARAGIEAYAEKFESSLLQKFHDATALGDIMTMRHCAETLLEFNGGDSCIRAWLNQHPLFAAGIDGTVPDAFDDDGDAESPSRKKEKQNATKKDNEIMCAPPSDFVHLLQQLKVCINQDWPMISTVFARAAPNAVLSLLIQRFFQQIIQNYVDKVLQEAAEVSNIHYLRLLASLLSTAKWSAAEFSGQTITTTQASSTNTRQNVRKRKIAGTTIERCMDEVFGQYANTLEREQENLKSVIQASTSNAQAYYMSRRQGAKKSLFSRSQKAAVTLAYPDLALDVEVVVNILRVHAAAVARCKLLHANPITSVATLTSILIHAIVAEYLEPAIDAASEDAAQSLESARSVPEYRYLCTVQSIGKIMHLVQCHYETIVVPVLAGTTSLKILRDAIDFKSELMGAIEAKCNHLVTSFAAGTALHLTTCLAKQKKTDYRSSNTTAPQATTSATSAGPIPTGSSAVSPASNSNTAGLALSHGDASPGVSPKMNVISDIQSESKPAAAASTSSLIAGFFSRSPTSPASGGASPAQQSAVVSPSGKSTYTSALTAAAGAVGTTAVGAAVASYFDSSGAGSGASDFNEQRLFSAACASFCSVLDAAQKAARSYLDGENATQFLRRIGADAHLMLLEHLKKYPVCPVGVLLLTRDLANYQDTVAKFKVPEVTSRFALLRDIGNLFFVRPENLPAVMQEGRLATLDITVLAAYIANRSDYKSAKIDRMIRTMLHPPSNAGASTITAMSNTLPSSSAGAASLNNAVMASGSMLLDSLGGPMQSSTANAVVMAATTSGLIN